MYPEAGIQVPAGTVHSSEDAKVAVLREAEEETGLAQLEFVGYLGGIQVDMTQFGILEIQDAEFFHLRCPGTPPDKWSHHETSGGTVAPIQFDFFWAALPNDVPDLIALNGQMLNELNKRMQGRPNQ